MKKKKVKTCRDVKNSKNTIIRKVFDTPKTLLTSFFFGICCISLLNPTSIIAMERAESDIQEGYKYNDQRFYKIDTINGIYNLISEIRAKEKKETPKILVAFDWDNTISLVDACEYPLREENTKEVIENIATNLNAEIFVLTSRLGGESADKVGKNALNIAKRMHEALPVITQTTPLKSVGDFQILGTSSHVLYYDGIVFAGFKEDDTSCSTSGSCKGKALAQLIDGVDVQIGETEYKRVNLGEFDALIFVDNDKGHLDAVEEEFARRPDKDKIHLIYYKQKPLLQGAEMQQKYCK